MAVSECYIVDFTAALNLLIKRLGNDEIPIIDIDQLKWRVMEMFEHVEPLTHLDRMTREMLANDWLYSKVDFPDTSFDVAIRKKGDLDNYLHEVILEFGRNMYAKIREVGLLSKGTERYKVLTLASNNEIYTLRQTRA